MRKVIIFTIFATCFLSSCSSNHSKDVHFVHMASFTNTYQGLAVSAVMEKQSSDKESEYFVGTAYGKDLNEAVEKLSREHSECYFATCEIYVISEDSDSDFLKKMTAICENPSLPSYARVVCVKAGGEKELLDSIKDENKLKKLLKLTKEDNVSIVNFLALSMSDDKSATLPIIALDGDGNENIAKTVVFNGKKENSK